MGTEIMGDRTPRTRKRSPAVGLLAAALILLLSASAVRLVQRVYIDTPPHMAPPVQFVFFGAPIVGLLLILWMATGWPRVPALLLLFPKHMVLATCSGAILFALSAVYWFHVSCQAAFLGLWWYLD
ncbi:hypothetical protein LCGC14_2455060 [marine sediment metagenome]|uniref:Uncharacterized protein n=1 Tax=marine sediment metagenome TaxID=412755 RepID=A0A0F9BEX1_9ZZZZ